MTVRAQSGFLTYQTHQSIPRCDGCGVWARMAKAARTIHFTRRDACQPDPWPFLAPDGSVAIPHSRWRADESLTCRYRCEEKKSEHEKPITPTNLFALHVRGLKRQT
ncbi:MAG: hypothetical protein GW801_13485 [Sphingomonadales bacterium]|nr:hypothetical protein [Sphingomonadales bacterium]